MPNRPARGEADWSPSRASNEAAPLDDAERRHAERSWAERSSVDRKRAEQEVGDGDLVLRTLSGNQSAFETLYRRYVSFAILLAVRIQGSRSDVEDLVHDAFLKAHQRLSELRDPSAFRSWLGSILVSQLRTRIRRGRWLRGVGLGGQEPIEVDSLAADDANPEVRAELAQLYSVLRRMPADQRIAWTLRYVERERLEDVAKLTDCSLATAKRRILRAQLFLEEHYVSHQLTEAAPSSPTRQRLEENRHGG